MEPKALIIAASAAAGVGFVHTILGPDHYVPFVMMSWARKWSGLKTTLITLLCGLGHIGSSVVLGFIGVALGLAVGRLEGVESVRGNIAAWLLIAFGLAYLAWGVRRVLRGKPHMHSHLHSGDSVHTHVHEHFTEHAHVHNNKAATSITPWALFVIFVFGPCEPLIPMVMYPAAKKNVLGLILVTCAFGVATIGTMLATVLIARMGVNLIPLAKAQRYSHVIAGATILVCGLAIRFLGL